MFELIDFIAVRPIVNILFVIYNFIGDFGFSLILFTLLIKILMWPIVKRQFHQTKLMRKIQPELAEIKKNCKGNRQLETLQMMDLYKKHNIKPFRSFLTLLIQLPIFFALISAINVMVLPREADNIEKRAYPIVSSMEKINQLIQKQKSHLTTGEKYDFKPMLFNTVDLSVRAGFTSLSSILILIFALGSAYTQYLMAKQQIPSNKSIKSRKFREILKDTSTEPSQAEMNDMISRQTAIMMPVMMLLIVINTPGALSLYYLLTNTISVIQQKIVLNKTGDEMEISADKAVLKELRKIKEAEVIENKKTGTKITRITAKDDKRRKS